MAGTPCDPRDVAIAALTNLIRLMGAELVAGTHRDDISRFEQAMRAKVGAVVVEGCTPENADAGVALARAHIERVLTQVRSQARSANFSEPRRSLPSRIAVEPVLH